MIFTQERLCGLDVTPCAASLDLADRAFGHVERCGDFRKTFATRQPAFYVNNIRLGQNGKAILGALPSCIADQRLRHAHPRFGRLRLSHFRLVRFGFASAHFLARFRRSLAAIPASAVRMVRQLTRMLLAVERNPAPFRFVPFALRFKQRDANFVSGLENLPDPPVSAAAAATTRGLGQMLGEAKFERLRRLADISDRFVVGRMQSVYRTQSLLTSCVALIGLLMVSHEMRLYHNPSGFEGLPAFRPRSEPTGLRPSR